MSIRLLYEYTEDEMHFAVQVSAVECLPLAFVEPDSAAAVAAIQMEGGADLQNKIIARTEQRAF